MSSYVSKWLTAPSSAGVVCLSDNLRVLRSLPDESVDLVYVDPPFNTGYKQTRKRTKTIADATANRAGFQGKKYRSKVVSSLSFDDSFDDFLDFLLPRVNEIHRILKPSGLLYLHLDYREVHYARLLLDSVFGFENFLNEIIWAYDYGARAKKKWPAKHDNILVFTKNSKEYYFDQSEVDRIPYMAPSLVTKEKRAAGKFPTDVWWHTIVSPTGKEKTGYPTQKPLGVLDRIVASSCPPGGVVLDCFAGSGTTGAASLSRGRKFILVDQSPDSIEVMKRRFKTFDVKFYKS